MKYSGFTMLMLLFFCSIVFAQSDYSVLVQESPAGAGEILPGIGVHNFSNNETVTLTTAPRAGYHFVSWLGDVQDPTANRTQLTVDGPKIVIAVFERDEYEALASDSPQISVGPPGLFMRSDSYTNSNSVSGSEREHHGDTDTDTEDSEEEDDPVPVPTPEPATLLLFAAGVFLTKLKRN